MATRFGYATAALAAAVLLAGGAPAFAGAAPGGPDGPGTVQAPTCSLTASMQRAACVKEASEDLFAANAVCLNLEEYEERVDCFADARESRGEAERLCRDQYRARRNLCGLLGEDRYDPEFDPELFEADFDAPTNPNPWFPLEIGARWTYEGGGERVTIEVLDKVKRIEGVPCVVVNDRVLVDGRLVEDTDDWFGLRKDGTVDYCGESVRNYEFFEGDDPEEAELVDVDGSWKHGRDGALAGTQMPAEPEAGETYRQEWAPGDAEDAATVLSASYAFGADADLDAFVPQALAELLCAAADCVVVEEFTPLEPGARGRKYYARGVGLFLEAKPASGETVRLSECNTDPKCAQLPAP